VPIVPRIGAYKQIFGGEADAANMLTAALDAAVVHGVLPEVGNLQVWLAGATSQLAAQLEAGKLIKR
jgi:hypothetical protein